MPKPKGNTRRLRPIVVHLGNIGEYRKGERPAEKTRRYARRFPGIQFIGIDLNRFEGRQRRNWRQLQDNYRKQLKRYSPESISLISSDMSLGHTFEFLLGPRATHREIFQTIYEKLKPGGKFLMTVGETQLEGKPNVVMMYLLACEIFGERNVEIKKVPPGKSWTHWMKRWEKEDKTPVYVITAMKERRKKK